jgi:hypothetical protein
MAGTLKNKIARSSGTSGGAAAQAFRALLNIVISDVRSTGLIRSSLWAKKGVKDGLNTLSAIESRKSSGLATKSKGTARFSNGSS